MIWRDGKVRVTRSIAEYPYYKVGQEKSFWSVVLEYNFEGIKGGSYIALGEEQAR